MITKNLNMSMLKSGLMLFIFLWGGGINAQQNTNNFMSFLPKSHENHLKKEYKNVLKIVKKDAKSYDFVEFGEVQNFLKDGKFKFNIKGLSNIEASITKLDYTDENDFLLLADIDGEHSGFLQLLADETGVFGQIEINERSFEIIGLKDRKSSLLVESKKDKPMKCGMDDKYHEKNGPKVTNENVAP